MLSRKGQQEIMGFAIVVVLIILAVAFWFMFTSGDKDTEQYERQTNRLASYTNYAVLDTSTQCRKQNIEDLLLDCLEGEFIINCGDSFAGVGSCDFVNRTIDDLLKATIGDNKGFWHDPSNLQGGLGLQRDYIFMVCRDSSCTNRLDDDIFINTAGWDKAGRPRCAGGFIQSTPILLTTGRGNFYYVVLRLCL